MQITRWRLNGAANELRAVEAELASLVQELQDANVWSGDDADRFQRDWGDSVRANLIGSAGTIESLPLEPSS